MKSTHIARTALAVAIAVALAGANAATVPVAPHAPSPDEVTDARATDGKLLLLRSGLIDPTVEHVDYSTTGAAADVATARYGIVQFEGDPAASRARLEKEGIVFLGYVPNNAYQVRIDGTTLSKLNSDTSVRWVGLYQPGQKLDPALWTAELNALPEAPQGGYEVDVFGFAGESADQLAAALLKVNGVRIMSVAKGDVPFARAHAEKADLAALIRAATAEDGVAWVAPHYQEYVNNTGGISAIQGNSTNIATAGIGIVEPGYQPMWDHDLFGSGQIISISDSGLDANEAWFTTLNKGAGDVTAITFADAVAPVPPAVGVASPDNKVYGYWVQPGATAYDNTVTCPGGSPTSYHGTHTSGTIAGDAGGTVLVIPYTASTPTSSGHELADGMAPNAQLLIQDIGNDTTGCLSITDLGGTIRQAHTAGAGIHSASWGSASAGVYSGSDRLADNALSVVEDMIFVVSAGNSGSGATTTGSPGNGKNVITVGALSHSGNRVVASYSSRGPTVDNRIKPDIMAPGSSVVSAAGDASTTSTIETPLTSTKSGTSMAAPTIAGNAGLMRQFFMDGFYPRGAKTVADSYTPSGMVMKAVLLNGTNPLLASNTTPSDQFATGNYGWGRAWLDGNLWFSTTPSAQGNDLRRMRIFERTNAAGVKTGDSQQYTIANVQAGQELRATLTWYDPEPSTGAALQLVNNLDLEVDGPGGTSYKGNVFTSGVSTTGGTADPRNTVEQVRLTAPTAGSYTFRVKATNVPGAARENTNRQGYAMVVSGAFGLPDTAAFAAPTSVVAGNSGGNVAVSFSAAGGAQGFQLYRAPGTCATASAGSFRLVGSSAASPAIDTTSQGGYSYAYKVRGIANDVEGTASACVDVTSAAACTLQPTFNTGSLEGGAFPNATCQVALDWMTATSNCPASSAVTYSVQRSVDPYFSAPTTIATGVATSSYSDFMATFAEPYYYKVLATDGAGNTAPISATAAGTAIGPSGIDGNAYLDDGDTHVFVAMDSPWQVTNTQSTLGNLSYHSGPDGGNYPASTCGSMTTAPIVVQAGANLNYQMKYNIETGWDILVQEISVDNGVTWTDLPPTGGYPASGTITSAGSACGFPVGKTGFGGSTSATPTNDAALASFQTFNTNMAAYSGQTVRLRWRFSSDGGYEVGGAFLDQITLSGTESDRIFSGHFETAVGPFTCSPL